MNKQQIKEIIKLAITQANLIKQGQGEYQKKPPSPAKTEDPRQVLGDKLQELLQAGKTQKTVQVTPEQLIRPIYDSRWQEAVTSAQKRMKEHPLSGYGFFPWAEKNLRQVIPVRVDKELIEENKTMKTNERAVAPMHYTPPNISESKEYIGWDPDAVLDVARRAKRPTLSALHAMMIHELTHAYAEPYKNPPSVFNSSVAYKTLIPAVFGNIDQRAKRLSNQLLTSWKRFFEQIAQQPEYYANTREIDARLAQTKRLYFLNTGKLVKTPEEAREMFNWARDSIVLEYPRAWKRNQGPLLEDIAEMAAIYNSLPEKFKQILRERATQLVANRKPEKAKGLV